MIATSRPGSPGMVDPDSGRFLQARRLSKLRGLWTDDPEFLIDHSTTLDINMLGLAVPFGLLPASDPRLLRIAESILRANDALKGDSNVLARSSYEPSQSNRSGSDSDQHDVSSLATLWMVRFLIQLGRETGQARHWSRALSMLEGIFGRLSQLGLSLRSAGRGMESARQVSNPGGTAWRLHAMLIDTILDLAGLDYDAVDHRLVPAAGPARTMAPDRDEAVVPLRRRLLPPRAADRRQGPSPEPQGSTETSRHARGRAHLSRPDGAGPLASVAPDARAHTRAPHRPTALERHLAVEHQRVELDLGLRKRVMIFVALLLAWACVVPTIVAAVAAARAAAPVRKCSAHGSWTSNPPCSTGNWGRSQS